MSYEKKTIKYKCEIYQLRMTKEKQNEFKEVATAIIKNAIEKSATEPRRIGFFGFLKEKM